MPHIQMLNFRFQISEKKGFTLIELMVAISILAIVSAIGLTTYFNAQVAGRDAKRKQDLRSLATALEVYYDAQAVHAYPVGGLTQLKTALAPPLYINQMPTDPGSFTYVYTGTPTTYALCARLENPNASGDGVVSSGTGCAGSSKYFYLVNP